MASAFPPSLTFLYERNQEATCYVGNLDLRVTDDILWELFVQCGPVVNIQVPRDKITGDHQGFAFIEFRCEEDSEYAIKLLHMVKLYGRAIKVNKASQDKRTQEVGANIFVGNLSEEVDEKVLKDIFTAFGVVLSTKIMRDPETGASKRYGFVSYDNFDSSDDAIKKLNGQYISGKPIEVQYAYKKDTKGDRHGSIAERILAANRPATLYNPIVNDTTNSMSTIPSFMNPPVNPMQGVNMMPKLPPQPTQMQMNYMPPMNMPQMNMPQMNRPPMNMPQMNMPPMNLPFNMMGQPGGFIKPPNMPPPNKF